jgi:transcriptional regulator with XRE-family HTH domain
MTFAETVRRLREAAGLTQAQLAERYGLHLSAVFKLEQGRRAPSWDTVQTLCEALGVSCDEFRAAPKGKAAAETQAAPRKANKRRKT